LGTVARNTRLEYVACVGHTKLETTAKYLNVTARYLALGADVDHELNERVPLTLVKC